MAAACQNYWRHWQVVIGKASLLASFAACHWQRVIGGGLSTLSVSVAACHWQSVVVSVIRSLSLAECHWRRLLVLPLAKRHWQRLVNIVGVIDRDSLMADRCHCYCQLQLVLVRASLAVVACHHLWRHWNSVIGGGLLSLETSLAACHCQSIVYQ